MRTIGKYIVRGLLGRGGMGKVYKAEHPILGKMVALKCLEPPEILTELVGKKRLEERFMAESVTMAGLNHPNIVDVLDIETTDENIFYVMDYYCNNLGIMIGETYRTETPSRPLGVDKTIHYATQTLKGLNRLHHAGIIHRDIKPYNMMVTDQDEVKICDFGLSIYRGETTAGPANLNMGSPYYAAPEQEQKTADATFSTDIYSLGVMIHRMLTGMLPGGRNKDKNGSLLNLIHPDLDDSWDDFLLKAIATEPDRRFTDANEMLNRLMALKHQWDEKKEALCRLNPAPSASPDTATGEQKRRNRQPRRTPVKINTKMAPAVFPVDSLWRPKSYHESEFHKVNDKVIRDCSTGLFWQIAGSSYPVSFGDAREYIADLNISNFGNLNHWRLPTVDELLSIMMPVPLGRNLCLASVFDHLQQWLWSIDRKSFTAAWYASMDLGFIHWQDFTARYYVKGVCTGSDEPDRVSGSV
ncbi:MAG: protein kinase [Desulfobacteraceae bacterium]|nr:protein kinase [Desulfobacteraceae bacterium]